MAMNLTFLQRLQRQGLSLGALLASLAAALLAACSSPPPAPETPRASTPPPPTQASTAERKTASSAGTPREYRQDAAHHLYKLNAERIYQGRLPPLLYAIGVLDVELDRQGRVLGTHWKRAPKHAPEVMAEIEKTVRAAAPYPTPNRMGKVVYTDVWLWHKSGRFQLDTLTEGQD
mgnify:CR=1 FL=1